MDMATLLIIVAAILVALAWFRHDSRRSAHVDFHKAFNVDPSTQVIVADMGQGHGRTMDKPLFVDGLAGKPDVLFQGDNLWIVGEFKQAKYRGRIRRRDYYQTTLYIGMLKSKYPRADVEGRIAYTDQCRTVEYDPDLYQELLTHRPECLKLLNEAGL